MPVFDFRLFWAVLRRRAVMSSLFGVAAGLVCGIGDGVWVMKSFSFFLEPAFDRVLLRSTVVCAIVGIIRWR